MIRRFAASALALVACASVASAQVKLQQTFALGSKTRHVITTKIHQILDLDGMKFETRSEEVATVLQSVEPGDTAVQLRVRQTTEAIRAELSLPGGLSLSFDSVGGTVKADNPALDVLRDIYRALVGLEITFKLEKDVQDKSKPDKSYQVKEVEGIEAAEDRVRDVNPEVEDPLKNRLDPNRLQAAFVQQMNLFPGNDVRPGDTWDRTEILDIVGGQSLTFRKRYQYVGTVQAQGGATLDKIAATTQGVTYAMDTTVEATAKVKASDLKIASSEGTILFDRKLGTVVESHGVDRITGSLTMTIGGKDLPSDLDLTLDIATVLKK